MIRLNRIAHFHGNNPFKYFSPLTDECLGTFSDASSNTVGPVDQTVDVTVRGRLFSLNHDLPSRSMSNY